MMKVKGLKAHVRKEKFAITSISSNKLPINPFALIDDNKEITAIVKEDDLDKMSPIKTEKGYKIITFDEIFPFGTAIGFISKISTALAKKNISILCYSGYSTDHFMIKEKNINDAVSALKELGVVI